MYATIENSRTTSTPIEQKIEEDGQEKEKSSNVLWKEKEEGSSSVGKEERGVILSESDAAVEGIFPYHDEVRRGRGGAKRQEKDTKNK